MDVPVAPLAGTSLPYLPAHRPLGQSPVRHCEHQASDLSSQVQPVPMTAISKETTAPKVSTVFLQCL